MRDGFRPFLIVLAKYNTCVIKFLLSLSVLFILSTLYNVVLNAAKLLSLRGNFIAPMLVTFAY